MSDLIPDGERVSMERRAALAFGLALLLLGLFVYAAGWDNVIAAIYRTDPGIYLGAFGATVGCLLCRAFVWHRVLSIVDEPRPYWLTSGVFLTAMFTKYVVPYGQVASGVGIAAVVSRYYDAAYEEGLAGVVSADFLNYLPYYTLGGVGAGYVVIVHSPPVAELTPYALPVALLVALVALVIGVLWRHQSLVLRTVVGITTGLRRILERLFGRNVNVLQPENVKRRFRGFYTTLDLVARNRRAVAVALTVAHLGWLGLAVALYLTTQAIGAPISLGMAMFAVAVSKFGFVVPTPGGVGGVELALATVLYLLAPMAFATATAVALLWRLSTYWFTIAVGGLSAMAVTLKDPVPPGAD